MQEILKRLAELVTVLESKLKETDAKLVDLNAKTITADSREAKLDAKESELKDREAKVLPSEEVNRIKQENEELAAKAAEDLSETRRKVEAFGVYSKQKGEEITSKITALDGREAQVGKREELVSQRETELGEEKRNFKDKVMLDIQKKMKFI